MITVERYYLSSGDVVTINLNNAKNISSSNDGAIYKSKDGKAYLLINHNTVVMMETFDEPEEDHNYSWQIVRNIHAYIMG